MKIAVVDTGSNTIKMKIYECEVLPYYKLKEIYSEVKNTKLISYIKNDVLSPEGIMLLCQTLTELKNHAENIGYDIFSIFATASLRRTKNVREIIDTVYSFCNEKIDLVSGEDEAFFSFSGVKNTTDTFPDNCILLDMGGGSTEIVICENQEKIYSKSMNFGSLSLFLVCKNYDEMKDVVIRELKIALPSQYKNENSVLVGGTALAINKLYMHFFKDAEKHIMDYDKLLQMYNILKQDTEKNKALLSKLVPHRTTTVIPGLSAYLVIFGECGVKSISVSTKGIREGYVIEKILKGQNR